MIKKTLIILFLFSALFPTKTLAAVKVAATPKPSASLKYAKPKTSLILNLSNIKNLASISYELTYLSKNIEEGVFGVIKNPKTNTASRTLFLGTCSRKVCTAHKNVKNIAVELKFKTKTGAVTTKMLKL